jgi:amidohydrolase
MDIHHSIRESEAYIIGLRRWFHAHPELSLKEEGTARKIGEELDALGIPWQKLPPNHGIAALIKGGQPGKTIALRADIDALPVPEQTGLPFASAKEGLMHACGHDGHIAMLLGAAKVLSEGKNDLKGNVVLILQVAEEIGQGHEEVLAYFHEIGRVDAVIGLHIWSLIPEGEILLLPGPILAGVMSYTITIKGRGGHGGRPDQVADPIKAACELVLKYASIPSNFYDVLDHSVVNVGQMEAGTVGNVFPSQAKIHGGLRWFKPGGEKKLIQIMERIARGVGQIYGVTCEVDCFADIPPVLNDAGMIQAARELVPRIEGLRLSRQTDPICAGDNIGVYLEKYPGFYGMLGAGKAQGPVFPHHHEQFDIDEAALRKGAAFLAEFAADFLE